MKTKAELEAENIALLNANAILNATTVTLTGERDTARAENTRLTGEVNDRDNVVIPGLRTTITTANGTITTLTGDLDNARRDCELNRRRRNGALWGLGIAAVLCIGAFIWAFNAQGNASDAETVAGNAQHALSVAEKAAETAETAKAKAEADKTNAEKAQAKAEADKATAETQKADAERKLAEAEKAKKDAESALAAFKANPPTPTQPVVATPVVPNGGSSSIQVPDGEIRQLEKLEKRPGGLVCRYIPVKGGMINGRYVRPLFADKEGRMVCQVGPGESFADKVRSLSFDGIPESQIPDKSKIQVIRTVSYQGEIFHQLGLVE